MAKSLKYELYESLIYVYFEAKVHIILTHYSKYDVQSLKRQRHWIVKYTGCPPPPPRAKMDLFRKCCCFFNFQTMSVKLLHIYCIWTLLVLIYIETCHS